ncbi:MAG TPA: hypothetical protein PKH39_12320, partial [Woeseiaceae bacterium]|nr:hypothetical protein [Woeseiaceae bacterium]
LTHTWVDQLMHINMLTVGWSLAIGLPRLPFQAKIAFGIYALGMILAAGLVYASAVVPVCSTYTVQQQNEAGILLLGVASAAFVTLVVRGALILSNVAATKSLRRVS